MYLGTSTISEYNAVSDLVLTCVCIWILQLRRCVSKKERKEGKNQTKHANFMDDDNDNRLVCSFRIIVICFLHLFIFIFCAGGYVLHIALDGIIYTSLLRWQNYQYRVIGYNFTFYIICLDLICVLVSYVLYIYTYEFVYPFTNGPPWCILCV